MLGSLDENDPSSLQTPFLKEYKSSSEFGFLIKTLIVGDTRSGKSSLFRKFSDDVFSEGYRATTSVEFRHRYLTTQEAKCKIQVWDCVSTVSSHIMTSIYKSANAVLLTIDVNTMDATLTVKAWIEEIKKSSPSDVQIYLIGTKVDLPLDDRKISSEKLQELANELGIECMEVSSKSGQNVDGLFYKVVSEHQKLKGVRLTSGAVTPSLQKNVMGLRSTSESTESQPLSLASLMVDCNKCILM